jgi:hypothetical protein
MGGRNRKKAATHAGGGGNGPAGWLYFTL